MTPGRPSSTPTPNPCTRSAHASGSAISDRLGALALVVVCFLVLRSAAVSAAPAAGAENPRVEVAVAAAPPEATAMESVLRELLGRLPVTTQFARVDRVEARDVVTPRPDRTPALARMWLDLGDTRRATIYLVDGPWERILVRHVPLRNGMDEVAREEIGHIAGAAVEALLAGSRIGLARDEARAALGVAANKPPSPEGGTAAEAPAPDAAAAAEPGPPLGVRPPAPPDPPLPPPTPAVVVDAPAPRPGSTFALDLAYAAESWSSAGTVAHGPVIALRFTRPGQASRLGAWLVGQLRFPVIVDRRPIGVRLDGGALRALATVDVAVSRRTTMRVGAGGGIDLVYFEPQRNAPGNHQVLGGKLTVVPLLRAAAAVDLRVRDTLRAFAAVTADLDLVDVRYYVSVTDGQQTVFDPWLVRPGLTLGVTTHLTDGP